MTWKPIETAPRDRPFLARQDGEIYVAKYTKEDEPRLCFREHSLFINSRYRIIYTAMDGENVRAQVPVDEPWPEYFEHKWCLWTKGFDFAPTEWAEIP